ncbi:OsmC family protein [Trinickia sp.]|uniref:OsmC family protein n=1 Tax=Trinickia sp. TaxID=2571163 RepID=UPI003F8045F9
MAHSEHRYNVEVQWTGNQGTGTSGYREYSRDHVARAGAKPEIAGSSDAAFRGDPTRWNPEDLFVTAISACHQLWYLHLCADAGVCVLAYRDDAQGTMVDSPEPGRFTEIILRPRVVIRSGDDVQLAARLHHTAHEKCFLANSVNFPIRCEPLVELADN